MPARTGGAGDAVVRRAATDVWLRLARQVFVGGDAAGGLPVEADKAEPVDEPKRRRGSGRYTPWAEPLMRTLGVDAFDCPKCKGRMRLIAMVTERAAVRRFLTGVGELVDVPERSPSRGPPSFQSTVLRRQAIGDAA